MIIKGDFLYNNRKNHSALKIQNNQILIFGGTNDTEIPLNDDIYILEFKYL